MSLYVSVCASVYVCVRVFVITSLGRDMHTYERFLVVS